MCLATHNNPSPPQRIFQETQEVQIIRSLIFYPTTWLQYMGIQTGLEAVVVSGGRSWLFNCNITVTRPVSDDSLIFELCRTGQTRAVEALLEKGMASVVDTSPKGWKPLHVRCYVRVEDSVEIRTLTLAALLLQQVTSTSALC